MSLLNFDGKVVVVSGIGPGLGAALAIKFAEAGADVVLAARTQSRLDEVARTDRGYRTQGSRGGHGHHR